MTYVLKPAKGRGVALNTTTLREFSGGWNVLDSDLNMKPKYAPVADNMTVSENGVVGVRGGCGLFSDVPAQLGLASAVVTGCVYFQDRIVVTHSNGRIVTIDGQGNATVIWNATIAAAQSLPPWAGGSLLATFAVYNGKLIVCDGLNKPLEIDTLATPVVRYLADGASGSNANVPIGFYCLTVGNYLIISGDPAHLDRVWVSQSGAAGTWPGDPSSDATYVDVGKMVHVSNQAIRGIAQYRDKLVVCFDNAVITFTLGTYDTDGKHVVTQTDVIHGVGTASHRAIADIGIDLLMTNITGVTSFARTTEARAVEPDHVSKLIDTELVSRIARQSTTQLLYEVWSIFDDATDRYILAMPDFRHGEVNKLPNNPVTLNLHEPRIVTYLFPDHGLRVGNLVLINGVVPDPRSTITYALNGAHYVYSIIDANQFTVDYTSAPGTGGIDPLNAVRIGGNSVQVTYQRTESTMYVLNQVRSAKTRSWTRWHGLNMRAAVMTDQKRLLMFDVQGRLWLMDGPLNRYTEDFVSHADQRGIAFSWELPWGDFSARKNVKKVRYLSADVQGGSEYTVSAFVDGYLRDEFGRYDPAVKLELGGTRARGWGRGTQNYGGKRPSDDERLYDFPVRHKILKLRFDGTSTRSLRFVSISLLYQSGDVRM